MANPIYELYEKEVAKNERLSKKYEKVKLELDSIKAENKRLSFLYPYLKLSLIFFITAHLKPYERKGKFCKD